MQQNQWIQLSKGAYQILEEIGHGASSTVFLVQSLYRNLIQLPTLTTNIVPPDNISPLPTEQSNLDLARLDELLVGSKQAHLAGQLGMAQGNPSNSIENGRQSNPSPSQQQEDSEGGHEMFALKIVQIEADTAEQRRKEKEFWRQVAMLARLKHPGIVKLLDHGVAVREGRRELLLLTEWGKGGNFLRFLDAVSIANFPPNEVQAIYKHCIAQIVEIVDYLQTMGVSHRDLKAENFVLDDRCSLKLIDFGLAQHLSGENDLEQGRGYVGTKQYISPEMIDRVRQSCPRQYYSKSDVWSIGVLIYYIYTRRYPFTGSNTFWSLESIKNHQPDLTPFRDNTHLKTLLAAMLRKNPNERMSIREMKASPYFAGIDFATVFTKESPYLRLKRQLGEEILFTKEIIVRIHGQTKKRVVGLISKPQKITKPQPILDHRISNYSGIDIKKNLSQNTDAFGSQKKIVSSASLDPPPTFKNYLTINKIGATSHPKYLQIFANTTLSVGKGACRLDWPSKKGSIYQDEPQSVQLKFDSQQSLQAFVGNFHRIKESMG